VSPLLSRKSDTSNFDASDVKAIISFLCCIFIKN
jgi:hypothetical protein